MRFGHCFSSTRPVFWSKTGYVESQKTSVLVPLAWCHQVGRVNKPVAGVAKLSCHLDSLPWREHASLNHHAAWAIFTLEVVLTFVWTCQVVFSIAVLFQGWVIYATWVAYERGEGFAPLPMMPCMVLSAVRKQENHTAVPD